MEIVKSFTNIYALQLALSLKKNLRDSIAITHLSIKLNDGGGLTLNPGIKILTFELAKAS